MVKDVENRKIELIEQIKQLNDEALLAEIERKMAQLLQENTWKAIRPIQKMPTIEEMIKAQNYKPSSKETFFSKSKRT
jgi:hypothetical protein